MTLFFRHNEVMNELLNDRFDRIENKLDMQTIEIDFVIKDAQMVFNVYDL